MSDEKDLEFAKRPTTIKGTFGEYVYAYFIKKKYGITLIKASREDQARGIDWITPPDSLGRVTNIDVKTDIFKSDQYFIMAYQNEQGLRCPFSAVSQSDIIGVITLLWRDMLNWLQLTEKDIEGQYQITLKLKEEFDSGYQEDYYSKIIFENYITSICDIKAQSIKNLCHGFESKQLSEFNAKEVGGRIIKLAQKVYIGFVAAQIYWEAVEEKPLYTKILSSKEKALTIPFIYRKGRSVEIDEKDKTLPEMSIESLKWLYKETKQSPKTGFYSNIYHIRTKDEFLDILKELIDQKKPLETL